MKKPTCAVFVLALTVWGGACVTAGRGRIIEQRISDLEDGTRADRAKLQAEIERARTDLAKLEELLEEATSVVTRNSANLGTDVDALSTSLDALQGQVEELRQELHQARKDWASAAEQAAAPQAEAIPTSRDAHWSLAKARYQEASYEACRHLLRAYIDRYARDRNVPEAHYLVGQSYLNQEKPAKSLGEFRVVLEKHRKSKMVDDTLFAMATAFYKLRSCDDAKSALKTLLTKYRRSPHARDAKALQRKIARAPRRYCRSRHGRMPL